MDGNDNFLNTVKVVLVGTTHPGNIGAAARAIKNMGIFNLALVKPKEFPSDIAIYRSKAAKDILENAEIYECKRCAKSFLWQTETSWCPREMSCVGLLTIIKVAVIH